MSYLEQVKAIMEKVSIRSDQQETFKELSTYLDRIKSESDIVSRSATEVANVDFGSGAITYENPASGARTAIDMIISEAIRKDCVSCLTPGEMEVLRPVLSDLIEKDLFKYEYVIHKNTEGIEQVHRFRSRDLLNLWRSSVTEDGEVIDVRGVPSVEIPKEEPNFWVWIEVEPGHEILASTEEVIRTVENTGEKMRVVDPNVHARQLLGYMKDILDGIDE